MGFVWLMVILSMCLSFGLTWSWHMYDLNKHARVYKAMDDEVMLNTERISKYLDVLKTGGLTGGKEYLETLPSDQHGS